MLGLGMFVDVFLDMDALMMLYGFCVGLDWVGFGSMF